VRLFIGIDPSLNSTGLTFLHFDNEIKIREQFYIIKPDKLTKKEEKAEKETDNFNYKVYLKHDLSKYKEENHLYEFYKTMNMFVVIQFIYDIIIDECQKNIFETELDIYIVMEGISYGSSIRTKSVFDLAGLNYLIRYKILNTLSNAHLTIVPPSELKKFTTGKGNANKDVIINLFSVLYPNFKLPKLDDIADSFFMALYAKKIYEEQYTK
jgi:Holliday junction resolvasome RuvABC endonuclease subunit